MHDAAASQGLFCSMLEDGNIGPLLTWAIFESELFVICSLSLITQCVYHLTLDGFEFEVTWFCQTWEMQGKWTGSSGVLKSLGFVVTLFLWCDKWVTILLVCPAWKRFWLPLKHCCLCLTPFYPICKMELRFWTRAAQQASGSADRSESAAKALGIVSVKVLLA